MASGAELSVQVLSGEAIGDVVEDLARLRITVFREFPYLYDGDVAYERSYLAAFPETAGAVVVLARTGGEIVGAATAMPLAHEPPELTEPFRVAGYDPDEVFYLSESVLLAAYRGRGLGHAFFDAREAAARECGARYAAFCSVIRPADHPRRPPDYRPLDGFWRKRGYAAVEGLTTRIAWKDLDETEESAKALQVWLRKLV